MKVEKISFETLGIISNFCTMFSGFCKFVCTNQSVQ